MLHAAFPSVIVELEERSPLGTIRHGAADLTYAAATALERGEAWTVDRVPVTGEVCRSITHPARMAAWRGGLYAPGLAEAFSKFAEAVSRSGIGDFPFRLSVLNAAIRVARHAEWLAGTVERARLAPWPETGSVCCPLTGEIFSAIASGDMGTPFAFGVREATFAGVDPRHLAAFLDDAGGEMDAAEYLSHSLRVPERWFRDIDLLVEAGMDWAVARDFETFAASIESWNARQDVGLPFCDVSLVHVQPGEGGKAPLAWCQDHAARSTGLVQAVSDLSFPFRR